MSDYLLIEATTEIHKRLPVKSLLRFSCVSKTWMSLITTPDFITKHLTTQTTSTPPNHTLVRHYSKLHRKKVYSVHSDNQSFDDLNAQIEFPFLRQSRFYFRVVGFVNSLLCLSDDLFGYTDTIFLWIPFWSYTKLLVTCWLVIPYFSGATYVYEHYVRPFFLNPQQTGNIWYVPRKKDIFSKPDDILTAAEKYIEEHGPEAFEKLVNKDRETKFRSSNYTYFDEDHRY